jgi:hypothetical protein
MSSHSKKAPQMTRSRKIVPTVSMSALSASLLNTQKPFRQPSAGYGANPRCRQLIMKVGEHTEGLPVRAASGVDGARFWLPSVSRGLLVPPRECPAGIEGAGSNRENGLADWRRSLLAGPGSDFSEAPAPGCEPAALEPAAVPTCPPGPLLCPGVEDHLVTGDVREPALQAAHGLPGCLAGGDLAVVIGTALAVAVAVAATAMMCRTRLICRLPARDSRWRT